MNATESTPTPTVSDSRIEAAELIKNAYDKHGRCVLSCDCGGWELQVDGDAVNWELQLIGDGVNWELQADARRARDMIEHARYDHATPRNITVTVTTVALFLTR